MHRVSHAYLPARPYACADAEVLTRFADQTAHDLRRLWKPGLGTGGHHAAHHRKGKNSHYCMVTNHMNPIVEWTGVFRKLEWLIERVSGLTPRPDLSVNPRYRGV